MLYNFNSYEGMNEFDFTSNDSSKNIIWSVYMKQVTGLHLLILKWI